MAPTIMMRPIKKDWQRQSQSESEDDDMVGKKDIMPLVMLQGENKFSNILLAIQTLYRLLKPYIKVYNDINIKCNLN